MANLKNGMESLMQEIMEKAVKLMSAKYTDNEKIGIGLSMALDAKDGFGAYLEVVDKLEETNDKLLAQNKELLKKMEDVQKMEDFWASMVNGLYDRFNIVDNKLDSLSAKKKKKSE